MKSAPLLTLAALIFFSFAGLGQSNPYLHFSVPEGLPSSEVYDVYQDHNGFIWFATDNGVVRFDGKNMELFQTNEGLSDPVVFEFVEDAKQRLWFRTFSGKLSYFFEGKIHQYKYNDLLFQLCKGAFLESIEIDSKDQVWFGAGFNLGYIDARGEIKKILADTFEIVFRHAEKGYVSGGWGPIQRANKVRIDNNKYPLSLKGNTLMHQKICTINWRGTQYFSIGSCIYKVVGNSFEVAFQAPDQIVTLSLDHDDNLWIGYFRTGTACYQSFTSQIPIHFDFANSMTVSKVFQDRDGGYWISTTQDGVYYIPDIKLLSYKLPVHNKVINTLAINERTLIIDDTGLLLVLDRKGNVDYQKNLSDPSIWMFNESPKRLWISTRGGTYIFDDAFRLIKKMNHSFSSLSKDPKDTIRATYGSLVIHMDHDGNILSIPPSSKTIKRAIYCTEHYFFLSERIGLDAFTYDGKRIELPEPMGSVKMTKLTALNDSLIVVGTLGTGFFIFNEKRWTAQQYFSKHNFTANNIYSLLIVGEDLWLGTEKGLAIVSIKSLLAGKVAFTFLFQEKGNNRDKINHLTFNGEKVWAFTENSFYAIPPTFRKKSLPLFYRQNLMVNNQINPLTNGMQLNHDENNIEVNFGFIDFRNQAILARSRLSTENDWSYSTSRNIRLQSLQPGSYHLELEFSVDNLQWHQASRLDFTILPPWWKRWYVELSVILLLVLFGAIYFRRRVARVHERNNYLHLINTQQQQLIRAELDTLEAERNRIAKDLHDSVGTNLSAIKMTVRSILKKYNDPKSEIIENEFQNTIQDIKGIIHDLVPAGLDKYGLTEIVRSHSARIEENLDIKIEVNSFGPDINDPKLNLLSFRILQELMANTFKHAQASKVVIDINSFDDLLSIIYQDNGKGFDVETVRRGSGLYNIQSRVQTANGTVKFESGSFGVTYIIDIPLNQNGHDQNDISR